MTTNNAGLDSVKDRIRDAVLRSGPDLYQLADELHGHPEVAFEEHFASGQVARAMNAPGFDVARGAYGLETALRAEAGDGPLRVAVCAEYDALPDIGHACGHNIIAAAAVGAARALGEFRDDLGLGIRLLGTPAEEIGDGGGKILMLKQGAWDDVHLTMMVHPGPFNDLAPGLIAISAFDVEYHGKEAHATYFSHLGVNAGAAATIAEVAIAQMRPQLQAHERVHGIIDKFGSSANVLSGYSRLKYMIRSRSVPELEELRRRVLRCFEAGAVATGATMKVLRGTAPYAPLRTDHEAAQIFGRNVAEFSGRTFPAIGSGPPTSAGTDMGNVSEIVPTIHPMLGLDSFPVVNHQAEFTAYCTGDAARKAIIDGAIGMATTIAEIALSDHHRDRLLHPRRDRHQQAPDQA